MAVTAVLLQSVVPDAVRGRVMSFYLMSAGGVMAFANLGFGALADAWSPPILFLIPGMLYTLIVMLTVVAGVNLRRVYREGKVLVSSEPPAVAVTGAR